MRSDRRDINPTDRQTSRFDLRRLFKDAHKYADTDVERSSIHHTLGQSSTQAAPGNHTHDPNLHLTLAFTSGDIFWPHATWKRIPWNTVVHVRGNWAFSGVGSPSAQIVVPETGTYDVDFNCAWAQDGLGGDRNVDFVKNGVGGFYSVVPASGTGNNYPTNNLSFRTDYNKGDILYVQAYATLAAGFTTSMTPSRPIQWTLQKVNV